MQQSSNLSQVLLRGLWMILLGLILGGALGAFVSQQMPPIYQSNVYLLVVPASDNAATSTANDYAQAYSRLATDPAVIGEAVRESEVGVDPWDIERVVKVEVSPNAPILQITTSLRNPEDASTLANALGRGLSSFTERKAEDTGYQANFMAKAVSPENPALPNWTLNIATGAAAGLLVGGVIALLRERIALLRERLRQAWKAQADQRQARQEEKDRQRLESEMAQLGAQLGKSTERYRELEQHKQRLESEMAQFTKSAERYRELEQHKQRLESEMAQLDKQRRESEMAELGIIAERYRELEKDKQRLESEMAQFTKSAERYRELEKDKQRLESEMVQLGKSVERYRELRSKLRSDDPQKLRQGEEGRDSTGSLPLERAAGGPQRRD